MESDAATAGDGLRVAALIVEPMAYRLVADWAARHGHRLVLLVTTPGPPRTWLNRDYHDLVGIVPQTQDVLVSARMRRTVAPTLAALRPDLLVSFTFPHRIPPEVVAVPRLGAVNLHPTPLPRYRGPNPRRMLFDGSATVGAALHRLEAGFDAGAILACRERPLPAAPTPEAVRAAWLAVLAETLDEGTRRAIGGEWGEPQDETLATYAPSFTPQERRLEWAWPMALLRQRTNALSLFHPEAEAEIAGRRYAVARVTPLPEAAAGAAPGTVLERVGDRFVVAVGDGVVAVEVAVAATPDGADDGPAAGA